MKDRELDALVAEKVMGWTKKAPGVGMAWWALSDDTFVARAQGKKAWSPSNDIAAAWQVVEKVCGDQYNYVFRLHRLTGRRAPGRWWAFFEKSWEKFEGFGEDAPKAICLAALNAVGVDKMTGEDARG